MSKKMMKKLFVGILLQHDKDMLKRNSMLAILTQLVAEWKEITLKPENGMKRQ